MNDKLSVYTVVHHTKSHEMKTVVIASSMIKASESVDGIVMDVSEHSPVYDGYHVSSSGWNMMFSKPLYCEQSAAWSRFLIERNFHKGLEDK